MSASSRPTLRPILARASAKLTVIELFPTPPLPDAIDSTWVRLPGWANGITGSGRPPRSVWVNADRCSAFIAPMVRLIPVMPSTEPSALRTSDSMVLRSGQLATVNSTVRCTVPVSSTSSWSTMPNSVIGRRISGSITLASAWCAAT